jgi:UDP-N-acetylmuramoyl-L-alanyl-D-glutamate--2,6-diaminopimelate ligase
MHLDHLLEGIAVEDRRGDASVDVTGVTHDSRQVGPGSLFCCVPGRVTDGHDHAPGAVAAGAVALLCERPLDLPVAQVVVADARATMGPVAAAFHGHPSASMDVVGVTGTNGKTTTTFLLQAILEAAGRPTGVIGTLSGARTTPEAPELQARLAELRDEGRRAVAMEVSSHALAFDRVAGTRFRVAVFTNLSRDHLDFHETMEDYFAAKARLFEPRYADVAVVNADDPRGRLLADAAAPLRIWSMIDRGSSLRGLSEVRTVTSARRVATSPIIGRFPRSRSPPAPNTTVSCPSPATPRAATSRFSSSSGVWA